MGSKLLGMFALIAAMFVIAASPVSAQKKEPASKEDLEKLAKEVADLRTVVLGIQKELTEFRKEVKDGFAEQGKQIRELKDGQADLAKRVSSLEGTVKEILLEQKEGNKLTAKLELKVWKLEELSASLKKDIERLQKELNDERAKTFAALLKDKNRVKREVRVIRETPRYTYTSVAPCYDTYPVCGYVNCAPSRASVVSTPVYYPVYTPVYYYYPASSTYYTYYSSYWWYWNTGSSSWYPYYPYGRYYGLGYSPAAYWGYYGW